ncbi:MAG: type II toxin-antitoxin system VapC family toxin [Pseudonocardia sp.]|nr:type II toxin-antitoxin system VapC family toxin [Pseudonocardia sp.]
MILPDVNVLVYAFNDTSPRHVEYAAWLQGVLDADEPVGVSGVVLSGFLRIVTHPRIFDEPATPGDALDFVRAVRDADNAVVVEPGRRHWRIFTSLVESTGAVGNAVPDAWLAALAVESGCEWVTTDRGFARYPGLRLRHPLAS